LIQEKKRGEEGNVDGEDNGMAVVGNADQEGVTVKPKQRRVTFTYTPPVRCLCFFYLFFLDVIPRSLTISLTDRR